MVPGVAVIGGSVAGLASALLLARAGHGVTVLERDSDGLPADRDAAWAAWPRRGVPHLRQLHIFNARARAVLRRDLPDVYDAWLAAGAVETPLVEDDPEVVRVNSRRTTFEWVLRRAALDQPGVRFRAGSPAVGLDVRRSHAAGVLTSAGTIPADLVVDASGRRAVTTRWIDGVVTARGACGGVAATRWYRLHRRARVARSSRPPSQPQVRADLGYAACVLVPADDATFSVTFGYQADDGALRPLRRTAGFEAGLSAVPTVASCVHPERAAPISDVLYRGDGPNYVRRIGAGAPTGLVLVGDAAVYTNPSYGRGVGLALVHAAGLARVVDDHNGDVVAVPAAFDDVTRRELEPWYQAAVEGDRVRHAIAHRLIAGEPWASVGGPGDDPAVQFARALPTAIAQDPVVARAYYRTWHLLERPDALATEEMRARVGAFRPDVAPPSHPDHTAFARLVSAAR